MLLLALDFACGPVVGVTLVLTPGDSAERWLNDLRRQWQPRVLYHHPQVAEQGTASSAQICLDRHCLPSAMDPASLQEKIAEALIG